MTKGKLLFQQRIFLSRLTHRGISSCDVMGCVGDGQCWRWAVSVMGCVGDGLSCLRSAFNASSLHTDAVSMRFY